MRHINFYVCGLLVLTMMWFTVPVATASGQSDIVDTAVAAGSFDTLVAALQASGLTSTLKGEGPFTVFAPTDEAFAKLPEGTLESLLLPENKAKLQAILTYHVVPAKVSASEAIKLESAETVFGQEISIRTNYGKVMIDNAKVIQADISASNGVIHVIDSVMLPKDIVEIAISAGTFNTLVTAVQAAGLVETLKGGGPFTLFAPTDEAFTKLPEGTLDTLLKPENKEKLQAILTYHVIAGNVPSEEVVNLTSVKTVNGQSLSISAEAEGVTVNDAQVIQTDIKGLNGTIHVIDTVIVPKS